MSDIRLYRVMRDLEGKHCGNEYLGNLVTCGECKHWEVSENLGIGHCVKHRSFKRNFYCADGEHKESE
jgi:hypothetical protein